MYFSTAKEEEAEKTIFGESGFKVLGVRARGIRKYMVML